MILGEFGGEGGAFEVVQAGTNPPNPSNPNSYAIYGDVLEYGYSTEADLYQSHTGAHVKPIKPSKFPDVDRCRALFPYYPGFNIDLSRIVHITRDGIIIKNLQKRTTRAGFNRTMLSFSYSLSLS